MELKMTRWLMNGNLGTKTNCSTKKRERDEGLASGWMYIHM
jgi:hypothetical protein